MQKVLRGIALLGVSGVFLFGLVACGDDDESEKTRSSKSGATQAECKGPAETFPKRFAGTIMLKKYALDVPITVTVERDPTDHCVLQMVSTQKVNPMCGTVFSGAVHYNPADDEWEGVLETSGDEPLTIMEVRYRHRRVDSRVEVWNYLTDASEDELCHELEVTGYAFP